MGKGFGNGKGEGKVIRKYEGGGETIGKCKDLSDRHKVLRENDSEV